MWGAMKGIRSAGLGLVVAGLAAGALTTDARAQEGVLVKNLLGALGVIQEDKPQIDYRERAPLVLPPKMELRDPAQPGSVQARNPQWPNDPDVVARKRQAAEDRTPITQTDLYRSNNKNARLTSEEMRTGRRAGAEIPNAPQVRNESSWIHPDILRAQHKRTDTADAGDSAVRKSLTDPPSAYRRSATGQPIQGTWEAQHREDESDPKVFLRQQQMRRNQ